MGELGRKFRQHMLVCGYAEATRESYEQAMVALVRGRWKRRAMTERVFLLTIRDR